MEILRKPDFQAANECSVNMRNNSKETTVKKGYLFPPLDLLTKHPGTENAHQAQNILETATKIQQVFDSFKVKAHVSNTYCGPSITTYELTLEPKVKVNQILNLINDLKLNLAATNLDVDVPIPGKTSIGIEILNKTNNTVYLSELLESKEFQTHPSCLAFATGKDIFGKPVIEDISQIPSLLITGTTGSGKSIFVHSIIMSLLYKASPENVKLIMIDPKAVELSVYNGIPHLFIPVVTDPKKAVGALNWAVAEMTDRYNKFAEVNVRDLKGYNAKIEASEDVEGIDEKGKIKKLPQIVIIVDELADLMMVAPGEVEDTICRLAQLARAAGIHLIVTTQHPFAGVITKSIRECIHSRAAFHMPSIIDSHKIIGIDDVDKLFENGDMMFYLKSYQKPARIQGAFVSNDEIRKVVNFLIDQAPVVSYNKNIETQISKTASSAESSGEALKVDALFKEAGKFIIEKDKASIGMLQRMFKIGFNRAERIMDQLSDAKVVGPEEGTSPRKILMGMEEFEKYIDDYM